MHAYLLDSEVTENFPTVGGLLKRLAYSGSKLSDSSVPIHVTIAGLHRVTCMHAYAFLLSRQCIHVSLYSS